MSDMPVPESTADAYRNVGGAWIHRGARLGEGVVLEPGALIGDQVTLGEACWVGAGAVVRGPSEFGPRNRIYSYAVLGEAPQELDYAGQPTRLVVGEGNTFREHVTVHRGSVKGSGVTRIGDHNFFMVGSHIAHDCVVENHVVLANDVLLGGHSHIQSNVNMSGGSAIVQFTTVGRYAFLGGLSGSTMDCEPFLVHDGTPARPKGVNLVGLRRGQFPRKSLNSLKQAYRLLYRESVRASGDLAQVRRRLEEENLWTDESQELFNFIERSRDGRYGRMMHLRGEPPRDEPS